MFREGGLADDRVDRKRFITTPCVLGDCPVCTVQKAGPVTLIGE